MANFNEISCVALSRLIGTPNCPKVLDVCTDEDFALDPRVIPTAQRIHHRDPSLHHAGSDNIVVVCQKGKKLSHGVAAQLRNLGHSAIVLEGGVHGWRDANLPLLPLESMGISGKNTTWVTRHRPKVDRIACAWLIKRFVDPNAHFLFVPAAEVLAVADRFDAHPFDVTGCHWTHRGDLCSFDALMNDLTLNLPALQTVADIVRAADTGKSDQHPQAHGLLAISLGLSRMHKSDLDQLEHGLIMYDALYRWARDAQNEQHTSMKDTGP